MQRVNIKIPRELYLKLRAMIKGTGFSSVTEFVNFVLRTLALGGKISQRAKFRTRELEEIKQRLKELGYLR